ncbi:hypothetical protein M8J76_004137 [Diaphorina citri]|nr:hypothetical protein M8J76_004137 [Diaphorina citri]
MSLCQKRSKIPRVKKYRPKFSSKSQIAMFLIKKQFDKIETVLSENDEDYLGRNTDIILTTSHVCLEKISEEIRAGTIHHNDVKEMTEIIYKNLGVLFFAKSKLLVDKWGETFAVSMIKCFLGLSKLAMTKSHRVCLTQMSLLVDATLRKKFKSFLDTVLLMDDLDICYSVTLQIRLGLVSFGYSFSPSTLDIRDMLELARLGLDAAKRSGFIPWIFVCLTNLLYCSAKSFGFRRMANYRFAPVLLFTNEELELTRQETISTLSELKSFLPLICDEQIHRYVNVLDLAISEELACLRIKRRNVCRKKKRVCWKWDCLTPRPYGDIMFRFKSCLTSKHKPLYEKRRPPTVPWKKNRGSSQKKRN